MELRPGLKGGQLRILSRDQVYDIHLAILKVLEEHGVEIQHEATLKILDEAGADVDYKKQVAKFPEYLVEESIKKAPKIVRCCGRNPEEDFIVEGRKVYFGPCAGATHIIDLETKERRFGRLSDMADVAKISDALPNIDFVMGLTSASDVPSVVVGLREPYAVMSNTCKHVQAFCYGDGELTKALIRMAELIAGGSDELRKRPIISLYNEPSSPLIFGSEYVEALAEWSKAGLPIIWAPCPISGATAPITLAGSIVQGSAESLAGNVICQLVNPGVPFIFGSVPLVLDMKRALVSYGTVETMIKEVMLAQIAEYYQLPSWGTGGCSDSKVLDEQAVAEAALNLTIAALSGNNLVHDVGFIESAKGGSIELLVICDEIIAMLRRIMKGVSVDDETLATGAIMEAGHGGSFLGLKHTLKYFSSEHLVSELMDRSGWARWKREGEKTLAQRAREKAKRMLEEHEIEPLAKDVKEEIERIIREVEKTAAKKTA
jgi:trimethylamine--corrinoid protein Co-methyltransferase